VTKITLCYVASLILNRNVQPKWTPPTKMPPGAGETSSSQCWPLHALVGTIADHEGEILSVGAGWTKPCATSTAD
jgi:hypothetical protein